MNTQYQKLFAEQATLLAKIDAALHAERHVALGDVQRLIVEFRRSVYALDGYQVNVRSVSAHRQNIAILRQTKRGAVADARLHGLQPALVVGF